MTLALNGTVATWVVAARLLHDCQSTNDNAARLEYEKWLPLVDALRTRLLAAAPDVVGTPTIFNLFRACGLAGLLSDRLAREASWVSECVLNGCFGF
jgi:hypothetical protein